MRSTPGDGPGAARLLVVEDDQTILELLSGSLRFAGFDVVTAASGAEALRAVAASRPDLVLLDVMLPDGDGFEVVRRMRSSGPSGPVIFVTARDGVPDRVAGLALGADDYVTKPFSLDEVVERIRAVLRRAGRPSCGHPAARRRPGTRRRKPRSQAGRHPHRADAHRVQAAAVPDAERGPRAE
jgi:two-component system OmpR family response regulator